MYRPSRNERRVLELTSRADMDVTRDEIETSLTSLPIWIPPLGYLVALWHRSSSALSRRACTDALTQMFAKSRT